MSSFFLFETQRDRGGIRPQNITAELSYNPPPHFKLIKLKLQTQAKTALQQKLQNFHDVKFMSGVCTRKTFTELRNLS